MERERLQPIRRTDLDVEIDRLFHFMGIAQNEKLRRHWESRWRAAIAIREKEKASRASRTAR